MRNLKELTDEELKEEFIKWFGEEKWEEMEILPFIEELLSMVCNEYLGIDLIPVVFEEVPGNVAVLDTKLECIMLNPKYKHDKVTLVAAAIHELEHWYQIFYASTFDTPKARRWKYELEHYADISNPVDYVFQEIEIDAEAFAQIVLETEFGIKHKNSNPVMQELIDNYIQTRKILEE